MSTGTLSPSAVADTVRTAATDMFVRYLGVDAPENEAPRAFEDPGLLLVAAMISDGGSDLSGSGPVPTAVRRWLARSGGDNFDLSILRGLAGFVLALRRAAQTWPVLAPTAATARRLLVDSAAANTSPPGPTGWYHYDLIAGPSGTLLALAADADCTAEEVAPLADVLAGMCDPQLAGLRIGQYKGEKMRGFNHGQINAGLGHGVPGVVSALRAAAELGGLSDAGYAALTTATTWLSDRVIVNCHGLLTWDVIGRRGGDDHDPTRHASPRQAWCYGSPGNAWTLWEAGRVLGDDRLCDRALTVAGSFVDRFDEEFHLDAIYPDKVGICHGAAGILALVDAFDRHAGLPGAAALRDRLVGYLVERIEPTLAITHVDPGLLGGVSGVFAALLTAATPTDRSWLRAFGLR